MAKRIQRKRTKGWKMPPGAVYVGRPTIYGNPFIVVKKPDGFWWVVQENGKRDYHQSSCYANKDSAVRIAVSLYRRWLEETNEGRMMAALAQQQLCDHDLACWCDLGDPCHVDVLLEIANGGKQ
jgi:hypothetical protein